jgi:hypothetical protein
MKKLLILFGLLASTCVAQENFIWDKVIESEKPKSELYSTTKQFIAETWRSAQDVIQNDDKEGGSIIVKGISRQYYSFNAVNTVYYIYNYTVKFSLKDNKVRMQIENVKCDRGEHGALKLIQPTDTTYPKGYKPERCKAMQQYLKDELNQLLDKYKLYLAQSTIEKEW